MYMCLSPFESLLLLFFVTYLGENGLKCCCMDLIKMFSFLAAVCHFYLLLFQECKTEDVSHPGLKY